jgi:hypothetical protein
VFLDDVEMRKSAGTWSNRVRILGNNEPKWLTLPIKRSSGANLVNNTEIFDNACKEKLVSQISFAYRKSQYFSEVMKIVENIFSSPIQNLSKFNCEAIFKIIDFLQVDPPVFVNSSSYSVVSKATDRLIDLINQVGGDEYLCGDGSSSYLEPKKFDQQKITLTYQNFETRKYVQLHDSDFVSGLSIIDPLMTIGPLKTLDLIKSD